MRKNIRHPGESRDPWIGKAAQWIPVFAGMALLLFPAAPARADCTPAGDLVGPHTRTSWVQGGLVYDLTDDVLKTCDGTNWNTVSGGGGIPTMTMVQRNAIPSPATGLVIYNTTENRPEYFNGSEWLTMTNITASMDGATQARAAASCKNIKDNGYPGGDGVYWVDPDGAGAGAPFQTYCDMTTDGGGWTLVFNLKTSSGVIRHFYDNAFWKNTGGATGAAATPFAADYKNADAFSKLSATELRVAAHNGGTFIGSRWWSMAARTMSQITILADNTVVGTDAGNNDAASVNTADAVIRYAGGLVVNRKAGVGGGTADDYAVFGSGGGPGSAGIGATLGSTSSIYYAEVSTSNSNQAIGTDRGSGITTAASFDYAIYVR